MSSQRNEDCLSFCLLFLEILVSYIVQRSIPGLFTPPIQMIGAVVPGHSYWKGQAKSTTFLVQTFPLLQRLQIPSQMSLVGCALHKQLDATLRPVLMEQVTASVSLAIGFQSSKERETHYKRNICI